MHNAVIALLTAFFVGGAIAALLWRTRAEVRLIEQSLDGLDAPGADELHLFDRRFR